MARSEHITKAGWGKRRFAALVHQHFSTTPHGGPALEASSSHPALKKAIALWLGLESCDAIRFNSKLELSQDLIPGLGIVVGFVFSPSLIQPRPDSQA
ncbi:MAG: hypothetical protein U0941_05140 [Planctomycetaceae bacterium]